MNLADCYRALELEPGASLEEVKRAYRDLAQVWHPDRFAGKPALQERANAKLQEINVAYAELLARLENGAAPRSGADDSPPAGSTGAPRPPNARPRAERRTARQPGESGPPTESLRTVSPARPSARTVLSDWRTWLVAALAVGSLGFVALAMNRRRVPRLRPIALSSAASGHLRSVAAGAAHACGLTPDGQVLCWGGDDARQLGRPAASRCSDASGESYACDPQPAAVLGAPRLRSVHVGLDHTCGLSGDGSAFCWGAGYAGQLGDGTTTSRASPARVAGDVRFQALSVLGQHTCGLTAAGDAYCWGRDTDGQLGEPGALRLCRLANLVFGCAPAPVRVSASAPWLQIAAGASHTCGLEADGTARCWGSNRSGQLGTATSEYCPDDTGDNPCALRPVRVATTLRFRQLAAGAAHTCGLAVDSLAYCWGRNDAGQLGNAGTAATLQPTPVAGQRRFARLFAGGFHTCGVTAAGELYCWGQNAFGQLGTAPAGSCAGVPCSPTPRRVAVERVAEGSAGFFQTCVVTRKDELCWGRNDSGQSGTGEIRRGDARILAQPLQGAGPSGKGTGSAMRDMLGKARGAVRQAKQKADLPAAMERNGGW